MTVSFSEESTPRRGTKASAYCHGVSRTLDVACPAGVIVCSTTTTGHAKLPTTSGEVLQAIGAVAYDLVTLAPSASNDFAAADVAEVVDQGEIWCVAETGLAVGDQPYCRYASGSGGTQLGALRASADTSTAALLPNARVVAVTTGLAKISINLPYGGAS